MIIGQCGNLYIAGVVDGPLSGGTPKGIQFCANGNIADLSIYGFGSANNGGGTDGVEFTFPADALSNGDCIWVASEAANFTNFFGFVPCYVAGAPASINGDDAIELFCSGAVEDVFGDINVDGNGEIWEYTDGWAFGQNGTPATFDPADWIYSGIATWGGAVTNATAPNPYPSPMQNCPGVTCGITALSNPIIICSTVTVGVDMVTINIGYTGVDPAVSVLNNGAGMISGDDPAVTAGGTIIISSLNEGDTWSIELSSAGCTGLIATGTVSTTQCDPNVMNPCSALYIGGVIDGPLTGGQPKAIQLCANTNIADLSIFGVESVTNGNPSSGNPEFTFPSVPLNNGQCVWITGDATAFMTYFGFPADYVDGMANVNGDDPIQLYCNGTVTDVFGVVGVDGSGEPWEYADGWAASTDNMPSPVFDLNNWIFSGPDAIDNELTNETAMFPYPNIGAGVNCGLQGLSVSSTSCISNTNGIDQVVVYLDYVGLDPNISIVNNGSGTIGGSDPSVINNGTISILLFEGESWDIELVGMGCSGLISMGIAEACEEQMIPVDCIPPTFDAMATCVNEAGENAPLGTYYIEVSLTNAGSGALPLSVTAGTNTDVFNASGDVVFFGPFNHTGIGNGFQTVTVGTTGTACMNVVNVPETLCAYYVDADGNSDGSMDNTLNASGAWCDCGAAPEDNLIAGGNILSQADPSLFSAGPGFIQLYILVDNAGNILDYNNTGLFQQLMDGIYEVYAVNYEIIEASAVQTILDTDGITIDEFIIGTEQLCIEICSSAMYSLSCLCFNCPTIGVIGGPSLVCENEELLINVLGMSFDFPNNNNMDFGLDIVYYETANPPADIYGASVIGQIPFGDFTGMAPNQMAEITIDGSLLTQGQFTICAILDPLPEMEDMCRPFACYALNIIDGPQTPTIPNNPILVCMNESTNMVPEVIVIEKTPLCEDFETDGNGTRYFTSINEFAVDNSNALFLDYNFFSITNGMETIAGDSIEHVVFGQQGQYYFAAEDIDNGGVNPDSVTMTFPNIPISGCENIEFSGLFAEDDALDLRDDWDLGDLVYIEVSIDGGPFMKILQFAWTPFTPPPFATMFNNVASLDTDFDGIGDGLTGSPVLDSLFTSYTAPIVGTGTSLDFRITIIGLQSGDEDIAFDNLKITCTETIDAFNFYAEDPSVNQGATPVLTGSEYEPMTTVASSPETYYITAVNELGCESDPLEVTIAVQGETALSCNDNIQLSLGGNCEVFVNSDLILEDPNIDLYTVVLFDETDVELPNGIITKAEEGQTLRYQIYNNCTGNSCWGTITVEVKVKPRLSSPCEFVKGESHSIAGSIHDQNADEFGFEVIDDCQTIDLGVDGFFNYNCGEHTDPVWCAADMELTILDQSGSVVYTANFQNDYVNNITLPIGNYSLLLQAIQDNATGSYQLNIAVNDCLPNEDCVNWCGLEEDPLGGYLTVEDALITLDTSCFAPVSNFKADTLIMGDICDDRGQFHYVKYSGLIDIHGTPEKIELLTQGYWTATLDVNQVKAPQNLLLPCDGIYQPDEIYNTYYSSDDPLSMNEAIQRSYPYLETGKTRKVEALVDSLVHYNVYDTIPQMHLVNDQWVILQVVESEQRDSLRKVTAIVDMPILIPFTDGDKYCNIIVSHEDVEYPSCAGGKKIFRSWNILDWCNQELINLAAQEIELSDQEGPVFDEDLDDVTISIDPWSCSAIYQLPELLVSDHCSDDISFDWQATEGRVDRDRIVDLWASNSPVSIFVSAIDDCGNTTKDTFNLIIEDAVAPVAVCVDELTVSLSDFSGARLYADDFDGGSHDGPCGDVWFKVIRTDNLNGSADGFWNDNGPRRTPNYRTPPEPVFFPPYSCNNADGDDYVSDIYFDFALNLLGFSLSLNQVFFDDEVNFCCADVAQDEIEVLVRVFDRDPGPGPVDPRRMSKDLNGPIIVNGGLSTNFQPNDLYGHFTDCWVTVKVENKLVADIICQDAEIDCFEDVDDTPLPTAIGQICESVTIELLSETDNRTSCANGEIIREWFIDKDGDGTISTGDPYCEQIISVQSETGAFDPYTIKWPKHFDGTTYEGINVECEDEDNDGFTEVVTRSQIIQMGSAFECVPDETSTMPEWCDPTCGLVGYSVEVDTVQDETACLKLVKHWTVIDWCTWDVNGEENSNDEFIAIEDWAQGVCAACPAYGPAIADSVYFGYQEVKVDGYYAFDQIIKVLDKSKPQITVPDTVIVNITGGTQIKDEEVACFGHDIVQGSASDFCGGIQQEAVGLKWSVGIYDEDGNIILNEAGIGIEEFEGENFDFDTRNGSPGDVHYIQWSVNDGCGNFEEATTVVVFRDIKAPTPVCIAGLSTTVMPSNGEVVVWAKEYDLSSFDNCDHSEDLEMSLVISGDDPIRPGETDFGIQSSLLFTCEYAGTSQLLDLWVWDSSGNGDFCTITILIDGTCDQTTSTVRVGGDVFTENQSAVSDVTMNIHSDLPEYPLTSLTNSNGIYAFPFNPMGFNYTIVAKKEGDEMNGVSSIDLLILQNHISGKQLLDSPYKVIAADINNDQRISSVDMVALRNLILGITDTYPNNLSWRFVDAGQEFEDIYHPWPIREIIQRNNVEQSYEEEDFIGVKIGDLNSNVDPNSARFQADKKSKNTIVIKTHDQKVLQGETVSLALRSDQFINVYSMQFTLEFDKMNLLKYEGGELNISKENIGLHKNNLSFSWYNTESISTNEILFRFEFEALEDIALSDVIRLTSSITEKEIVVNKNYEPKDILLQIDKPTEVETTNQKFILYQNEPNPFSGITEINFELPYSGNVEISIYKADGTLARKVQAYFKKGLNHYPLSKSEIGTSGVYYYQLEQGENFATKKMIIID